MKENIQKLYKSMGLKELLSGPQVKKPNLNKRLDTEASEKSNTPGSSAEGYIFWLEEHPSALTSFHKMMSATEGKQIVVFLDYDGTLSPIDSDPNRAFMSDAMRSALRDVARYFPTAIISGRSRDKVYEFVRLDEVYYAGSHGMDIMGPPRHVKPNYEEKYQTNTIEKSNEFTVFQPAKDYLPSIKKMLKELKERTREVPGAFVEDNRFCVSVHYRHVSDEDYDTLKEIIRNVMLDYPGFHITQGKKVMEIRPSIEWNKGDALLYLLDTLGFADTNNAVPFYLGDDKTDEDAFKVLQGIGLGYPIIVSSVPKETSASHSLRDPSEVLAFLLYLARWGKGLSRS